MSVTQQIKPPVKVLEWLGDASTGFLRLLDQTRLPEKTEFVDCRNVQAVWQAIRSLVVRGPAIGVAAAYGMVVAGQKIAADEGFGAGLAAAGEYLKACRPTAVNLQWGVGRVLEAANALPGASRDEILSAMLDRARQVHAEDEAMCLAIGRYAAADCPAMFGCADALQRRAPWPPPASALPPRACTSFTPPGPARPMPSPWSSIATRPARCSRAAA